MDQDLLERANKTAAGLDLPMNSWATWLVYLLEALETEAYESHLDPYHPQRYDVILETVRDAIDDRLDKGRWE